MDHLRVVVLTIDQLVEILAALLAAGYTQAGTIAVVQAALDRPTYTHEEATP